MDENRGRIRRARGSLIRTGIGSQDIDPTVDNLVVNVSMDLGFRVSLLHDGTGIQIIPLYRNEISITPDGASLKIQTTLKK